MYISHSVFCFVGGVYIPPTEDPVGTLHKKRQCYIAYIISLLNFSGEVNKKLLNTVNTKYISSDNIKNHTVFKLTSIDKKGQNITMRPVGNTLSLSRTSQMVSEQMMELMTVLLVSTVITAHSASHSGHGGHTGKQDFSN